MAEKCLLFPWESFSLVFRLITFNYLPDNHISDYNINIVRNYTFENGYLLLGPQWFFGAATTYLLNIRCSSMEPRADSENYSNLRTVAQVNNSCCGIITAEVAMNNLPLFICLTISDEYFRITKI